MNNLITNLYTQPTYKYEILYNCYTTRATPISEKHVVIPCKTSAHTHQFHGLPIPLKFSILTSPCGHLCTSTTRTKLASVSYSKIPIIIATPGLIGCDQDNLLICITIYPELTNLYPS